VANNAELAFVASSRRLGQLIGEGVDLSREQEIAHSFFAMGDALALRKALEGQGFAVSERADIPGLVARRRELLVSGNLKGLVEQLCRTADKYAADYEGWDLAVRTAPMDEAG
jgi:hypothetical protein